MTDITFITSNQTKIAHARYLCRNYDVNILQYKKLFYGVGYHEPRIYDRSELLKESFEDAVKRWKKNVSNYGERLFFIEDTSVRIEALSDDKNEVPGVDIKYWMQENSFETLDRELRKRGNNRKVSVSSHIVLFLTEKLKKYLGTTDDCRIFKSVSHGYIVEKECVFDSQVLYPWLDNKTFNKWFVPDGFTTPISTLKIEEANKGDFRKGAFVEMLTFLQKNNQIMKSSTPILDLKIQFDDIYILCGQTCSGKSTIGKYLVDKYGYYHIEASDFMTLKYHETHGTNFIVDKNIYAAEILKIEPDYVVKKILEFIKEHDIYDKFIITGFRTKYEVETFMQMFPSQKIKLIYLQASFYQRYKRWNTRHRDNDNYTIDRFSEIDNIQKEIGVTTISSIDNVSIFENNGNNISKLYNNFRKTFLGDLSITAPYNVEKILTCNRISLEKAILLTLALEYQKNESKSFTTTEISKKINEYFKGFRKNKNNISRYFNQSYYLYYEIKKDNKINKYKISPIGYSEAILIMRVLTNSSLSIIDQNNAYKVVEHDEANSQHELFL